MQYDFIAIPDAEIPKAVEPTFQHVVITYASETNKTASVWRGAAYPSTPAHLPSPDAGADVAAPGRARAGPGDLRAFRRREVGRGRPDLLPGGGEAGRVIACLAVPELSKNPLDSSRYLHIQ